MSELLSIVENEQTSEFYPTPKNLVEKMIAGIDWSYVDTILEPSAGKGDILREIARQEKERRGKGFNVDCIEIDPNLRQILKFNFGARRAELEAKQNEIKRKYKYCEHRLGDGWTYAKYHDNGYEYVPVPSADGERLNAISDEYKCFFDDGIHIVHDNFLTYEQFKQYDLIIMNPPFSNGDKHLLKALEMQKNGGNIICLLNAETIRNPYTETRMELSRKLKEYNAEIEYIENAFTSAERKTGVEIALIKVHIESVPEESEIYKRFEKAESVDDVYSDITDLEVTDFIKAIVTRYNVEVKSGLELIRLYRALEPYMQNTFEEQSYGKEPILKLVDDNSSSYSKNATINSYLKKVRFKYWRALLSNEKFVGKLTSKLQDEYRTKVNAFADYEFSEFNIYTLSAEMNSQIKKGIEDQIISMFDTLTAEHSWYPECEKNKHYYDGWKTNKAHKIDKKVIVPFYSLSGNSYGGAFGYWGEKLDVHNCFGCLGDVEKILNYLDGNMTSPVDLQERLTIASNNGQTKNIQLKYFKATFYKKGTVHLVFTCPELIERFNIYAAQNKQWLPPVYGKKRYEDMEADEKAVIDSFQGEKAYNEILQRANYYLAPVTGNTVLMLGE